MKSQKKLIEMVCTGNNGRSPIAELIARNRLEEAGALEEYDSISSGTLVSVIKSGNFPIKAMNPIIEVARNRGDVYNAQQLEELDTALKEGDTETVKKYFSVAAKLFEEEEKISRGIVLRELGIKGDVKSTQDQTVVRPNTVAIFVMDNENYQRAQKIYEGSGYNPTMESLGVENSFGLVRDAYRGRVRQLLERVPKVVDRILGA